MDELTTLRDVGRDTPGPTAGETAAARARLQAAIDDALSGPFLAARSSGGRALLTRLARPKLWAPLSAAAAVTVVAVAAAVLAAPGPHRPGPASAPGRLTAATLLDQAALAAERQIPGQGRYFFSEIEVMPPGAPPLLQMTWVGDGVPGRQAFVGPQTPFYSRRLPVPYEIQVGQTFLTWARLRRLPTAPGPLLAAIERATGPYPAATQLDTITSLLAEAPLTPALRAGLYRAAALLPGLTVRPHVRDLVGRRATEVYLPPTKRDAGSALLVDPATGAFLGLAQLLLPPRHGPCAADEEEAVLSAGYVGSDYRFVPGTPRAPRPAVWPNVIPYCPIPTGGKPSPSPGSPAPGGAPTPSPAGNPSPTPGRTPSPSAGNPSPAP
jgi:hypothetical protein